MMQGDGFNEKGYIVKESINLYGKEERMEMKAVSGLYGGVFDANPTLENLARQLSWTFGFKYLTAWFDPVLETIIELWRERPQYINGKWMSWDGYPPRISFRAVTAFGHELNLSEYWRRDRLPDCVIDWSRCIIRVIQGDEYFFGPDIEEDEEEYRTDIARDLAGKVTREEFMEAAGRTYDTIKGMEGMVYIPSADCKVVRDEDGNIVKLLRREAKEEDGK